MPDLTQHVRALNHFFNLLAYNPNGTEGPDKADRQEGYLFWLAWVDAHGQPAVLELGRERRRSAR